MDEGSTLGLPIDALTERMPGRQVGARRDTTSQWIEIPNSSRNLVWRSQLEASPATPPQHPCLIFFFELIFEARTATNANKSL